MDCKYVSPELIALSEKGSSNELLQATALAHAREWASYAVDQQAEEGGVLPTAEYFSDTWTDLLSDEKRALADILRKYGMHIMHQYEQERAQSVRTNEVLATED